MKRPILHLALLASAAAGSHARCSTIDDSCIESWELVNFQPRSPTFNQPVRSESYGSRTTVILLLASG